MKLAFVVPRYGTRIVGGAETLVREYATRLATAGHAIEVLTTCARDHTTWLNHFSAGEAWESGVRVRRFPVSTRRDQAAVARIQRTLDAGLCIDPASERLWVENTGASQQMFEAIDLAADRVDALIFAPYLFASTVLGAKVRPDRSIIIPCLHDEAYARFAIVKDTLRSAAGLIFNSAPERDLARRLLGDIPPHRVVGIGFDRPERVDPDAFRRRRALAGDLVVYAGRREGGKNFPLLVEYVALYAGALSRSGPVTLVTTGSGSVDVPESAKRLVADLGFVSADEKYEAIAASIATTLLSVNESFSYLINEGWLCGVPAIVHADCAVTCNACERSGGGLWIRSAEEFAEALDRLRIDQDLRRDLGRAGQTWVLQHNSWHAVLARLEDAVRSIVQ
jgi:glycosyltransferase involved in cell wall biosynthesis